MLRTFSFATALLVTLALPALAESAPNKTPGATTGAKTATRGNLFTEEQARTHLSRLGYTSISALTKDENGVWRGAATKDGKILTVAVDVKGGEVKN